jgi:hypothetical protein
MAVYITFLPNRGYSAESMGAKWWVGMKNTTDASAVASVQADGDELEKILRETNVIRSTVKRVQTWYGTDAQFIVRNVINNT